jgi:hypothetical protein
MRERRIYDNYSDIKMRLMEDGDWFLYQFLDIPRDEYKQWVSDFAVYNHGIPIDILSLFEIDAVAKLHGIIFLVRFKDIKLDKLQEEKQTERLKKEFDELKNNKLK